MIPMVMAANTTPPTDPSAITRGTFTEPLREARTAET